MPRAAFSVPRHPIGVVSRRTGLKPPVIRAWERRYGAIDPKRDDNDHRLYSDQHIERLLLLREVTQGGWSIGQVAGMDNRQLEDLIAPERGLGLPYRAGPPAGERRLTSPGSPGAVTAVVPAPLGSESGTSLSTPERAQGGGDASMADSILGICLSALRRLDGSGLEGQLERGLGALDPRVLLDRVLVPFLAAVGQGQRDGTLRQLHGNLAYASVRSFLGRMGRGRGRVDAPRMVLATPAGQYHELGTLLAAVSASLEGWTVNYIGPGLPPEDIAAGARAGRARAVALGLTFPLGDALLHEELGRLAASLEGEASLILGGRAAPAYGAALDGAVIVAEDLRHFRRILAGLA